MGQFLASWLVWFYKMQSLDDANAYQPWPYCLHNWLAHVGSIPRSPHKRACSFSASNLGVRNEALLHLTRHHLATIYDILLKYEIQV